MEEGKKIVSDEETWGERGSLLTAAINRGGLSQENDSASAPSSS